MSSFRRLLEYCRPYWWRIALAAIGSVGVGSMDGALAYLVEPVLKKIFSGKDTRIFVLLPLGIVALYALRGVCRFTNDYFDTRLATISTGRNWRTVLALLELAEA